MSNLANIWIAMSTQALTQFRLKHTEGENYSGPMDDGTYRILEKMSDQEVVQGLFKRPTIGGKTYNLFSIYLPGSARVAEAINKLTTDWPTHLIMLGAWWMDGRQVGTNFTYSDPDPETAAVTVTGVSGTPKYPLPAATWRIMPDVVAYDESGAVASTIAASSNADLRDINLLLGQEPRRFTS